MYLCGGYVHMRAGGQGGQKGGDFGAGITSNCELPNVRGGN